MFFNYPFCSKLYSYEFAAQLAEHLTLNQGVGRSSLFGFTKKLAGIKKQLKRVFGKIKFLFVSGLM